jgi:hypothetical protein
MRNCLLYVGIRAIINEPEWKEEYKDLKDRKRGVSNLHNIIDLLLRYGDFLYRVLCTILKGTSITSAFPNSFLKL